MAPPLSAKVRSYWMKDRIKIRIEDVQEKFLKHNLTEGQVRSWCRGHECGGIKKRHDGRTGGTARKRFASEREEEEKTSGHELDFLVQNPKKPFSEPAQKALRRNLVSGLQPSSLARYKSAWKALQRFADTHGFPNFADDEDELVLMFAKWVEEGKGPTTWNQAISLWTRANHTKMDDVPMVSPTLFGLVKEHNTAWGKKNARVRRPVGEPQLKAIKAHIDGLDDMPVKDRQAVHLLVDTIATLGLRPRELMQVTPASFRGNYLCFKETKGKVSTQQVSIPTNHLPSWTAIAKRWKQARFKGMKSEFRAVKSRWHEEVKEPYIVLPSGAPFEYADLYRLVTDGAGSAPTPERGLTDSYTPHGFRHTVAVQLLEKYGLSEEKACRLLRMSSSILIRYAQR